MRHCRDAAPRDDGGNYSVAGCRSPRASKEQDVAVSILQRETAETIVSVFQWLDKVDMTRSKLGRQSIRVRNIKKGVPASDSLLDVSRGVWLWLNANSFEQNLSAAAANDAEEDVVGSRPLKGDIKAKPVSVKGERCRDVSHDKEGGDCGDLGLRHDERRTPRRSVNGRNWR
jgi:hypothetical protein